MNVDLGYTQQLLEWIKSKIYLNARAVNASKKNIRKINRGQVYYCDFGIGIGSEMRKKRPAVIVQNDIANIKSPNTLVVPITHNTTTLPGIITINDKYDNSGALLLDGSANTSNVISVSKARLGDFICKLDNEEMKLLDEALAKSLDLMKYYSREQKKLTDKINYIGKLKEQRNQAQDFATDVIKLVEDEVDDIHEELSKLTTKYFTN